jgi:Activator of Hsp90 ATPase homolog 1-like protein
MLDPTLTVDPVIRESVVRASLVTCFTTFVDRIATWWPPEHHVGGPASDMRIEPEVGGRCYDVTEDGSESQWGTVLVFDRPDRLCFAWHVQADWTIDLDPQRQSDVDVTFTASGADQTVVRIEHRHLERHGDGAPGLRVGVDSPGGWSAIVARFVDAAEGREPRPLPPDTST